MGIPRRTGWISKPHFQIRGISPWALAHRLWREPDANACRLIHGAGVMVLASLVTLTMSNAETSAGLTLIGGGLTLVEEGPAVAMAGDPAPLNLATGATPFSDSGLGTELGLTFHLAANLNDQQYGNSFSWIGGSTSPFPDRFAGIDLGMLETDVQSIAFGRSNVLAGDPCGVGVCTDRHLGMYTLQYTQVADPSTDLGLATTADPATGWVNIGEFDYGTSDGPGTNYNNTWERHRYNFGPVDATGVRLVLGQADTAIDEIELYNVPGAFRAPSATTTAFHGHSGWRI